MLHIRLEDAPNTSFLSFFPLQVITFRPFVHHYIKQLLRQYYGYKTTATHRRAKPQTTRRGGVCRQSGTYWRRPVMPQRDDGTLFPCHERTQSKRSESTPTRQIRTQQGALRGITLCHAGG